MNELIEFLKQYKTILILGFGKEGKSTLNFIDKNINDIKIGIADINLINDIKSNNKIIYHNGENYLNAIYDYDLIIKSPGVSLKNIKIDDIKSKITSQTDLFLKFYKKQTIGITGTKGKSTTSSLIFHILDSAQKDCILAGNIGLPVFDIIDKIRKNTIIVLELSSHQLQFCRNSPHISILLNIFQEHLDHYNGFDEYAFSKYNIHLFQKSDDYFIYNKFDDEINKLMGLFKIENIKIPIDYNASLKQIKDIDIPIIGDHNRLNALIAINCVEILGLEEKEIKNYIRTFISLPHRLEYIGKYKNIYFYNDSISTIPQSTIAALNTVKNVDSIILGGFDRGIEYSLLIDELIAKPLRNIILMGTVGDLIYKLLSDKNIDSKQIFRVKTLDEAVNVCFNETEQGKTCLLSPAASSYDQFKNFEQRGDMFKSLVKNHF